MKSILHNLVRLTPWLACCIGATALAAPTTAPAGKPVTNLWVDTEIRQVVQDIASQTGTVILCDQTVQGMLSMSVKDMPLQECLERVCAAGGYALAQVKDYYVIGKADATSPLFQRVAEPHRIKLTYITPDQVKSLLHASLAPYVTFDKAAGAVIVTAPENIRQRAIDAIRLMDQANPQVAIEAVVFELSEAGSKNLGLDWQFKSGKWSAGVNDLVGMITYSEASDLGTYVDLTLRAIVETRKGQVLANPRLLVMHNTEADIFVGQEKYFTLLSGQASNPYYTLQSIKAGVTLKVLPYIGKDGQITLTLEPEVSDVITDTDRENGIDGLTRPTNLPVVSRRHARTVVNIQDGQSVLIGGLLMEHNRSIVDKVPVAGDIPGIGAAFRNVKGTRQQVEVVILITAHVVESQRPAADTIERRLERRYISPLDALLVPSKESR